MCRILASANRRLDGIGVEAGPRGVHANMTESPLTPRGQRGGGALLVVLALGLCGLIAFRPEELRVPAWVAYVASSSFGFAGLTLVAAGLGAKRTQRWLIVAVATAMVLPALWIAVGDGDRGCTASFRSIQVGSDVLCRGAFGIGAVQRTEQPDSRSACDSALAHLLHP